MQDKDFDRFIQQAFENQPEPEYNPADWDKLEDRLHNLNAPQANPAGPSASAGFGKLGFVASAILVTAFNVSLFTKPELFKNAIGSAEKVAVVQPADQSEKSAATTQPEIAVANTSRTIETAETSETIAATNNNIAEAATQTETAPAFNELPAIAPVQAEANEANKTVVKPAAAKNRTRTNTKNAGKPNRPATTNWAWPTVAANRPVTQSGNAGFYAGKPVATAQPCNVTVKPEIAAILIGNDTVNDSRIELTSCNLLEARFFTKGENADNIVVTSNAASVLPGARFVTEPGSEVATLQWQPSPEMVRQQAYNVTVWVADKRCQQEAPRAYQVALNVKPAFTAAINGTTRINKGQETILEVKGAPLGSTYQWLTGSKILTENANGRLVTIPAGSTTYRVFVSAPSGCVFTDSVRVEVVPGSLLANTKIVPNIFTPNNDGLNDYFEVQLPEEGPYALEVFDRDGRLVFGQKEYDNRWNAPKLQSGTYYYIITTPRENKSYKGWVEIIR